jgi:hypothetical protein
MNPILAEIFPVLLKKLPRQADFLDYKWFFHEIEDPYAYIADERILKLAHKDLISAIESSDADLFSAENYPLPFEKFVYVLKLHAPSTGLPVRYEVFKFQRENGLLSCNHFVIEKRPVGFSCKPTVTVEYSHFEPKTYEYHFGVMPSPGSSWTIEALERITRSDPEDVETEGEHFANLTNFALTCSTYGMFGPVSDTQHYYSTTNPDPIRNAQKIARGNRPKFEWVSSVIEPRTTAPALVLHRGGTHASPKPHERRAHFRRLKSGKSVLVRSTVINKDKMGDRGFVFHDYELSA